MKVAWTPPSSVTDLGMGLLGDLQRALGLVDRRGDGGRADDVRLFLCDARGERLIAEIVRHRVDETDVRIAGGFQRSGEIGHPGRRPIAGDFGAAGMVVWVDKKNAQRSSPSVFLTSRNVNFD